MADIEVTASNWRQVEVGRVVFFGSGPYTGRIAAISEIIDHKRVCDTSVDTAGSTPTWMQLAQVMADKKSLDPR